MRPDASLLALQRDFFAALREPLTGQAREATSLRARAGKNSQAFSATARRHICPSPTLEPEERLDLYHRQYWYRVLDSLEEDFPALKALLGERRFWALAEAYLAATPSRSFTLRHHGWSLADFLAANPALAGSVAVAAEDTARLEIALCVAFEAGELPAASPAELAIGRLALQPHVRLLALRSRADRIRDQALDSKTVPRSLARTASATATHYVAVHRFQHRVLVEALDPGAFRMLERLSGACTLAEAVEAGGLDENAQNASLIQEWFALWTSRDWLAAAAVPS